MQDYDREAWLLKSIPVYKGNDILPKTIYNSGICVQKYESKGNRDCLIQCVESTTERETLSYVETLKACGFLEESYYVMENNLFYRFVRGNNRVFVNYYGSEQKVLIALEEEKGISAKEISYTYKPKDGERAEFYMFGIKMDPNGMNIAIPENTSGYLNNGQSMFVKCSDNSIIVIDGGDGCQMEPEDEVRFSKLLHQITRTDENEVITVSAWFITHAHPDHVQGFARVLRENPKKYKVERVICNLPNSNYLDGVHEKGICRTIGTIAEVCPEAQNIKVHTGDVIQIADITLTILYTHEDIVNEAGIIASQNFNATSTVVMVEAASGMKMLVTGDLTPRPEKTLCNHFSAKTLSCDIFQQPHHNFNDNAIVYEYANAQVILILQASGGLVKNEDMIRRWTLAKQWCREWYCGGDETVGFAYENGKIKRIYHAQDIYEQSRLWKDKKNIKERVRDERK